MQVNITTTGEEKKTEVSNIQSTLGANFEIVKVLYDQPNRKYHNFGHILYMFDIAKQQGFKLNELQRLAILYHDSIYVTSRKTDISNEIMSIKLAHSHLIKIIPKPALKLVCRMILDTKDHVPGIELSKEIIDLDLWILSEPEIIYEAYRKNIREEYSHLNDEEWKIARKDWLKKMFHRRTLYYTKNIEAVQALAERNLAKELSGYS